MFQSTIAQGASPQHPPHIAHSPQISWESIRERAGSALQSSSHFSPWGQSHEHRQLAAHHGDQHAAPPCAGTSGCRCQLLLSRSPLSLGHLYSTFNIQQLLCLCWDNLGRKRLLNLGVIFFYTVRNAKITSLDKQYTLVGFLVEYSVSCPTRNWPELVFNIWTSPFQAQIAIPEKKNAGNLYKLLILDVGYCWPLPKCQDGERQPHHRVRFEWRPQFQTQIQDLDVAFGFNPIPSHIHLM